MNLHILPDSKFSNRLISRLNELGLATRNKFVVISPRPQLAHVQFPVDFGKINSSRFLNATGDTRQYEKVFIHQFTPLLYKWVAKNSFNQLNWAIWGGDLYNLPGFDKFLYEPQTLKYVQSRFSVSEFLYQQKVRLLHEQYKERAYAKVNNILTWMKGEYQFALNHILALKAAHQFFFYENDVPYAQVEAGENKARSNSEDVYLILGNSGTPTNNHLDALDFLLKNPVSSRVIIPVAYGDKHYIRFLRKRCADYSSKIRIEFMDKFLSFPDYLIFLRQSEGFISNTIRPQGYGNIFLMMAVGKPVFFNTANISIPDLKALGMDVQPLDRIGAHKTPVASNQGIISSVFSEEKLLTLYGEIFN